MNTTQTSEDTNNATTSLLLAVGRGDRSAFEQLFDLMSPRVLGLATTVLRDQDLAAETTQDVMVEVWEKAPLFDPAKGSAATWILVMARRRAIDRVRSEQSRRNRDLKVGSLDATETGLDEDSINLRLDTRQLPELLDTLTPLQREALVLSFYDGLSYPEVAKRLDIPLGTAKTRIRDALGSLRVQLGTPT